MTTSTPAGLAGLIPQDLAVGDPDLAGRLTVFPLLAPDGPTEYRSFAEAHAHGFVIKEREERAAVNDLTAFNPLDVPVLLYEGEEVVGAQQDRTLDITVLVGPGARLDVPVTCVEHGRWDDARHGEHFAASPRATFPSLRHTKNRAVRARLAAGLDARAEQGEVWEEVEIKSQILDVQSPTGAMGGLYEGRGEELERHEAAFTRRDGQVGMLACLDGRPTVLDYVSRADVFASLFRPLLRGYCLDAIERPLDGSTEPARPELANAFVGATRACVPQRRRAVGMGDALAFSGRGVGGSGLALADELVQLTVFAEDSPRSPRILRPSRRR